MKRKKTDSEYCLSENNVVNYITYVESTLQTWSELDFEDNDFVNFKYSIHEELGQLLREVEEMKKDLLALNSENTKLVLDKAFQRLYKEIFQ